MRKFLLACCMILALAWATGAMAQDPNYTVKPGDSLSAIAQKYYGDAMDYKKIAHYNNISNPDLIQPGQRLRIPG